MSDYKWEEVLRNCVIDNKIKAIHLQHIPQLKACDDWNDAIFIGRVKYQFKLTNYDGGLVKLAGRIYYINLKQIQALASVVRWNISNTIIVYE